MHFKLRLIPTAVAGMLLAACGGGGGGSSSTASTPVNGTLVDGYLNFAKVVCDTNENGKYDAGEPVTYTSNTGDGKFTFNPGCGHSVLGGVDGTGSSADTGLAFVGLLRAPAGASVVTPLTTLLASGMTSAQVTTALNLPAGTDLLKVDPAATNTDGSLKNAALLKKTLAVQQLLQKTTEMVNGLGGMSGSVATEAVYTQVALALANTLKSGPSLISGDATPVMNTAVVNSMLTAAVTGIANASTVDTSVKAALTAAGGTATLPTVINTALTSQAQAVLSTSDSTITATVLDRQANTSITDTVKAAVTAGTLSSSTPPSALSNLANSTATEAAKPTPAPASHVPTPASGSTTLLTFDESTVAFTDMGQYGGAAPTVEAPPSSDAGKALRIAKPSGAQVWAGVYFGVKQAIPFTSTRKTITAAVYATRANAVIKLKVQVSEADFVEVAGTATGAANTWGTVSWDLSAVDASKAYTTVAITPDATLPTDGQSYYLDNIALAGAGTAAGNYLYLPNNAIGFSADGTNGGAVNYSMATFQSTGINIKWPMSNAAAMKLNLAENGTFNLAAGQTLSAAVQIEDTAAGSQGLIRAYTDKVTVSKSGSNITLNVPDLPQALIYGVSGDGNTKAVINFAAKVQGISNTLSTAVNAISTVMFGEVVNYGITGLSNQFTNMGALRGRYKVTIVVNQLPLRKADGTLFDSLTLQMPTTVSGGVPGNLVPVTGYGLVGYINLTD